MHITRIEIESQVEAGRIIELSASPGAGGAYGASGASGRGVDVLVRIGSRDRLIHAPTSSDREERRRSIAMAIAAEIYGRDSSGEVNAGDEQINGILGVMQKLADGWAVEM